MNASCKNTNILYFTTSEVQSYNNFSKDLPVDPYPPHQTFDTFLFS